MKLHFTDEEFVSREYKVIQSMKQKKLEAILLFSQESMYWLTGYDTFGYVFFQCLIFTQNGYSLLERGLYYLGRFPGNNRYRNMRYFINIFIYLFILL